MQQITNKVLLTPTQIITLILLYIKVMHGMQNYYVIALSCTPHIELDQSWTDVWVHLRLLIAGEHKPPHTETTHLARLGLQVWGGVR